MDQKREESRLDLDGVKTLIEYLRSVGVVSFTGFGVSVVLTPKEPDYVPTPTEPTKKVTSIWENPNLWPGGEPPKFPGK